MDTYYRLSEGCAGLTLVERHIPYSKFRQLVGKFKSDTRGLFKDTLVRFLIYASSFDQNLTISIVFRQLQCRIYMTWGLTPKRGRRRIDHPAPSHQSPFQFHSILHRLLLSTVRYSIRTTF